MAKTKSRGNGDGTIYFIENKKLWAAQYTIGRNESGKLIRRTVYGKTRKAVKDKLEAIITQLNTQTYAEPSKLTVCQMIKGLIDEDYSLNIINDNSYLRKEATYKRIQAHAIGSIPIQEVTDNNLKAYLTSITNLSNSVISKDYALLNRCFKVAIQKDIIHKNPMDGVRKPKSDKPTRKVRALTLKEQKKLIQVLNNEEKSAPYRPQLLLMMYTGMRMGEINALDIQDINFTFKTIHIHRTVTRDKTEHTIIGKTTKTYAGQRLLSLSDTTNKLLKEYMAGYQENSMNLLFFDYRSNKVITTSQVNMYFQRLLKKYHILDDAVPGEITLHSLRHTFATRCIESGMPVKVLQKLLGHADIKTTLDTYCDVFEQYEQKHVNKVEKYLKKQALIG